MGTAWLGLGAPSLQRGGLAAPRPEGPRAAWPQTADGAAPWGRGSPTALGRHELVPATPGVVLAASGENQPGAVLWPDGAVLVKNVICRPLWAVNQNADVGPLRVLREGQRRAPAGSGLGGPRLAPAGQILGPGVPTARGPPGTPAGRRTRPPGTTAEPGAAELRVPALSGARGPDPPGRAPPGPAGRGRGYGAAAAAGPARPARPRGFFRWVVYFLNLFPLS